MIALRAAVGYRTAKRGDGDGREGAVFVTVGVDDVELALVPNGGGIGPFGVFPSCSAHNNGVGCTPLVAMMKLTSRKAV